MNWMLEWYYKSAGKYKEKTLEKSIDLESCFGRG